MKQQLISEVERIEKGIEKSQTLEEEGTQQFKERARGKYKKSIRKIQTL